jgi:RNA polymerase sigma-70 factor (ECF subfamily)
MSVLSDAESSQFREIYDTTYRSVHKYVTRRISDEVDDLVEDTYITAWRRRESIPIEAEERLLWIYGIARRLIANRLRLRSRRSRFVREFGPLNHEAPSTESAAVASVIVHSALGKMRQRDREILLLVEWEGLTLHQAAQVLGVAPTTATKRLATARERFKAFCGSVKVPTP